MATRMATPTPICKRRNTDWVILSATGGKDASVHKSVACAEPVRKRRRVRKRKLVEAKVEAFDRAGVAGGFVHVNEHGVHLDVILGDHEARGHGVVEKVFQDALLFHSDYRIMWSGHADIRDVSRSSGENVRIGRGYVGVRTKHRGNFSVQVP